MTPDHAAHVRDALCYGGAFVIFVWCCLHQLSCWGRRQWPYDAPEPAVPGPPRDEQLKACRSAAASGVALAEEVAQETTMFGKPPEEVIGYKVKVGGGRFPDTVIGKLIYGHKPKWLSRRGFTQKAFHGTGAQVSLDGHGAYTVCLDSLNLCGVVVYPGDEGGRIVAEGLAGKVGKVRPYTAGEWADDYAIDYAQLNDEPIPERRNPVTDWEDETGS